MKARRFNINRKYFWMELGFILFLSFAIALISDLEYSAYEEHNIANFKNDFGYRLVTGSFAMIAYSVYYWGFLKGYVFRRNLTGIILCSFAFVILDHLFDKYITNWILIHTFFISPEFRQRALKELLSPRIFFTFNYPLISTIFPLSGLAFLVRSLSQDSDMKELKEQQLISELNYLKAQLHPHFFFNTMNNIYSLALRQSADTAPLVAKLADMMRYILYEADRKIVLLSKEIKFISDYIDAEKIRQHDTNQISFDVQGITADAHIEPLLLLPFIENAFKHGLQEETDEGFIHIVILMADKELTLQVTNSKPQKMLGNPKGIGLQNAVKRLDLLYPDNYVLDIKDGPSQYSLNLSLQTV